MPAGRTGLLPVGILLAAVVLAAGCGGASNQPGPSPSPSGEPPRIPTGAPTPSAGRPIPAPDPLTATPPAGGTAVPATQVDATGLPPGFPTLTWTQGSRTLGVFGRAGGCTEARAELVEQTAERVMVRVVQATTSPGPCTREVRYPPLTVTLGADLGGRRVVLVGVVA